MMPDIRSVARRVYRAGCLTGEVRDLDHLALSLCSGNVGPRCTKGKYGTGQAERYFSLGLSLLVYF